MSLRILAVLFTWMVAAIAPAAVASVPPELQFWEDWVLHGHESARCPFLAGEGDARACAWPGRLVIEVDERGARFAVDVATSAEAWFALPGDDMTWPQDATVDGRPAPVVARDGAPQLRLLPGTHRVAGALRWERRPDALPLGLARVLVSLVVDGESRDAVIDGDGRLWFGRREAATTSAVRNAAALRVFRRLEDGIPPMLSSRLELDVSGEDREVLLGRALPEGFAPVALDGGGLPARLEASGDLRVQVRPGHWVLLLVARQLAASQPYRAEPRALSPDVAWPTTETWVFQADHALRTARLEGATGVDPRQAGLPEEWQSLPAWSLSAGTTMTLLEQARGDANPQPEPLSLSHELWLDFDGGGYTVRDRLAGTLERSGRLAFAPDVVPGRVTLNGEPQVITALAKGQAGIEVRPGPLEVESVSRIAREGELAATGYARDVRRLSAVLHLPPGWTLFAAGGVDRAASWLSGWTLWDIFLLLVLVVAVFRLAGTRAAAIALATLLATHAVDGAPLLLWLNLVVAVAVWRVLPDGRVRRVAGGWRWLSLGVLALVLLSFAVDQVRRGIYPELEYAWRDIHAPEGTMAGAPPAALDEAMAAPAADAPEAPAAAVAGGLAEESAPVRRLAKSAVRENLRAMGVMPGSVVASSITSVAPVDPGARVQTGPGVPEWQWNRVDLAWDGPVAASQPVDLWLVGPLANRALCFLRVLLCAGLLFVLARVVAVRADATDDSSGGAGTTTSPVISLALLIALAASLLPQPSHAAFPDPALLEELRNRLLAPAECQPSCVSLASVRVEADADVLRVRLRLDALASLGAPLPSAGNGWQPRSVLVDGRQAAFSAQGAQRYVLLEAGAHDVVLEGPLQGSDTLSLAFPLLPGRVELALRGWQGSGVVDGRLAGGALELRRVAAARDTTSEPGGKRLLNDPEPPFVIVERRLRFDIDWQVDTRVVRVAPSSAPVSVAVPLLPGESVTSRVNVQDGAVLVALAQDESEFTWHSLLKPSATLALVAAKGAPYVERWVVEAATRWHVEASGIPARKGEGGTSWYPWPGETLSLAVTKPQPVAGDTLTIESARVRHEPGHRAAVTTVSLRLLASEGGDYRFRLPEGAVLESLSIDGNEQVLAGDGREAVIPVHPGEQLAVVRFRGSEDMGVLARTPALDFGRAVTNLDLELAVPPERWALFTGGPGAGPAILYWGVLAVVIVVALLLARVPGSPLVAHEWLLLALGMSTTMLPFTLVVVAWFFVMAGRGRVDPSAMRAGVFNFTQVLLALFTALALGVLLTTIPQSLVLGAPDMQVAGNGSHAGLLHWYVDRTAALLPQGWLVSLPLWVYRVAMLAWSLWLAIALVRWLRWGWQQYSAGAPWRSDGDEWTRYREDDDGTR